MWAPVWGRLFTEACTAHSQLHSWRKEKWLAFSSQYLPTAAQVACACVRSWVPSSSMLEILLLLEELFLFFAGFSCFLFCKSTALVPQLTPGKKEEAETTFLPTLLLQPYQIQGPSLVSGLGELYRLVIPTSCLNSFWQASLTSVVAETLLRF